jgi:hypothetical protein
MEIHLKIVSPPVYPLLCSFLEHSTEVLPLNKHFGLLDTQPFLRLASLGLRYSHHSLFELHGLLTNPFPE